MGRSDTREALRRHFEVDTGHVVLAVLDGLLADGKVGEDRRRRRDRPLRHRPRSHRPVLGVTVMPGV